MGAPYVSPSVSNYNVNPPTDDGSTTSANRIDWSKTKLKIGDPLKTYADAINSAAGTAFGKLPGGAGVLSTAVDYTVLAADQGKLVKVTVSGKIVTSPDATAVGSPFLFRVVNESTGDITFTGNNPGVQQTIDGSTSVTIPSGSGLTAETDGANWFTGGQNFVRTQIVPQGRLTTASAIPILAGDVASATSVYYTPYIGDLWPVSDGTKFTVLEFTEQTLTLVSNHVANGIYDVFQFNDAGTVRIGTGPVWNTVTAGSCTRGTGAGTTELARLKGLYVNNVSMTARNGASTYSVGAKAGLYLGSIYIDAVAGQVTCHRGYGQSRKFGVWNAYNRSKTILRTGDSTASWLYTSAVWRSSNNSAANSCTVFTGLVEEIFDIQFQQRKIVQVGTAGNEVRIGLGLNSTSSPSGFVTVSEYNSSVGVIFTGEPAKFISPPLLGINVINCLEYCGANTATFDGTENSMLMTASYRG